MHHERTQADLERALAATDWVFWGGLCVSQGVTIQWKKYRRLKNHFLYGTYDPATKIVELNVRLSEPDVPEFVLLGVIHHELCHHVVGPEHNSDFMEMEQKNPNYWKFSRWCESYMGSSGSWVG